MDLKKAVASFGLIGRMAPVGTNVSNRLDIGIAATEVDFLAQDGDTDILYSAKVVAAAVSDSGSLALSTGIVTAGGTAVVTGGDGKDAEGETLPAPVSLMGILIRNLGAGDVAIVSSDDEVPDCPALKPTCSLFMIAGTTWPSSPFGTVVGTMNNAAGIFDVTVIGISV